MADIPAGRIDCYWVAGLLGVGNCLSEVARRGTKTSFRARELEPICEMPT